MSFYGWDSPDIVYLYSTSRKKLQKVFREMQVCEFAWKHPELVFDTEDPEAKAKVAADPGVGAAGPGYGRGFCRCVPWHAGIPPQNLKTTVPVRSAGNFNSACDGRGVCVEIKCSEESVKLET